jgi:hypothetical protein
MGPLTGAWYIPVMKTMESNAVTTSDDATLEEEGLEKEYVYDDDEEGEIREPEGRWKR